ncbi:hypothetical protein PIB30_005940 [Stylosanthes scabra]|uniref:Uncharacterized protein n=1 Tax=Stylosanthes scabra TaxID=79078 RepID=A0ABU6S3I4_9FABA|nr:hypothetical protein [Stylosanthes scabra]
MEVAKFLALPTILALFILSLHFITKLVKLRKDPNLNLPPGNLGWPIVGESFEYMRAARAGTMIGTKGSYAEEFSAKLDDFIRGLLGFPINLPGTKFHRSIKAADEITSEVKMMVRKRKLDLQEKKVSHTQDLLSYLIVTPDSNGRFMTETEIGDNMLLLLFAGHDTTRSALSSIMKYLGAMPQVYEQVFKGFATQSFNMFSTF